MKIVVQIRLGGSSAAIIHQIMYIHCVASGYGKIQGLNASQVFRAHGGVVGMRDSLEQKETQHHRQHQCDRKFTDKKLKIYNGSDSFLRKLIFIPRSRLRVAHGITKSAGPNNMKDGSGHWTAQSRIRPRYQCMEQKFISVHACQNRKWVFFTSLSGLESNIKKVYTDSVSLSVSIIVSLLPQSC